MSKKDKVIKQAFNNPNGLSFLDFENLLKQCQWVFKRQNGSHAIWHSPQGHRLVIQNRNGQAKAYQVKQFLDQIKKDHHERYF